MGAHLQWEFLILDITSINILQLSHVFSECPHSGECRGKKEKFICKLLVCVCAITLGTTNKPHSCKKLHPMQATAKNH